MSNFDYGHEHFGHEVDMRCNICGGTDGRHYPVDKEDECYNLNLGGNFAAKAVFGVFVVIGILVGIALPPLGALIIYFGACLTGI